MNGTGARLVAPGREAAAIVGWLALTIGSAAVVLWGLDAVPRLFTGDSRGVQRVRTIEAAERALGERLFLPAYFPDTLVWPPASILVLRRPVPAVAVVFGREQADGGLICYQARGARATIPMALMPAGQVLVETPVEMPEGEARLVRLQSADGAIVNDLIWFLGDRTLGLRYDGPAEELLTIARSLRQRRP